MPFLDLDEATAVEAGFHSTALALQKLGEPAFREAELHALVKTMRQLQAAPGVLALGGGTPTHKDSFDLLAGLIEQRVVRVAYLRCEPRTLEDRLRSTDLTTRPSLTGTDTLSEVPLLFAQRDPIYRALADRTFQVDTLPVEMASLAVSSWFKSHIEN
jgi:shikimate kinase